MNCFLCLRTIDTGMRAQDMYANVGHLSPKVYCFSFNFFSFHCKGILYRPSCNELNNFKFVVYSSNLHLFETKAQHKLEVMNKYFSYLLKCNIYFLLDS